MKIVIDVDDNTYTHLFDSGMEIVPQVGEILLAVKNGTPLPKGHGRLIDEKEILNNPDGIYYDLYDVPEYLEKCIPTVIEADKEVDE